MTATDDHLARRLAYVHANDRKYISVDNTGLLRLTTRGQPCIEGTDGIVARFARGAEVDTLATDYGTTRRAIEAAIRTMMRLDRNVR